MSSYKVAAAQTAFTDVSTILSPRENTYLYTLYRIHPNMPCPLNDRFMNAFPKTRAIRSLVLTLLVREALPGPLGRLVLCHRIIGLIIIRREFSKLMSNHIFRDQHIIIYLAIVDLKYKANKVGQNRGRTCLGLNWWYFLAWSGSLNRKTMRLCEQKSG